MTTTNNINFIAYAEPEEPGSFGFLYLLVDGRYYRFSRETQEGIAVVSFDRLEELYEDVRAARKYADNWLVFSSLEEAPFNQNTVEMIVESAREHGAIPSLNEVMYG